MRSETDTTRPVLPSAEPEQTVGRRRLPALLLVLLALLAVFFLRGHLNLETLGDHHEKLIALRDRNYVIAAVIFSAVYVTLVLCSVPITFANLTGGYLFGPVAGVIFNVFSATVGAALVFSAVRRGAGQRRLDTGRRSVQRLLRALRENELSVLLLMRLVPVVPFVVANVVPALVGVRPARFVITTFFGIIPGTFAFSWLGASLSDALLDEDGTEFSMLGEPLIFAPVLLLCVAVGLPLAVRIWRKSG